MSGQICVTVFATELAKRQFCRRISRKEKATWDLPESRTRTCHRTLVGFWIKGDFLEVLEPLLITFRKELEPVVG